MIKDSTGVLTTNLKNGLPGNYCHIGPFLQEFSDGLPVLVYHKLGFPGIFSSNKGLFISPRLFERQLAELKAHGFAACEPGLVTNPGCRLAITFDDGYESAFKHALEFLRQYDFPAIQYLPAGYLGKRSSWDRKGEKIMDHSQVHDWLQAGHLIGAHTVSHPHLTKVNETRARDEIGDSRKILEDKFGVEVRHFCYPYGEWDSKLAEWVAEAGYRTAVTVDFGVNKTGCDLFSMKRIHAYVPLRSATGMYYFLRR